MSGQDKVITDLRTIKRKGTNITYVTVKSQIRLVRRVAFGEIVFGIVILFSQTIAIASSLEFATRSLTGIWTSWFFLISAGISLFWSSRCTFNGLLAVLVLQIISATMGIPLFTATCLLFGVYPFKWSLAPNGEGAALIGSSTAILATNLIMMVCSIAQLVLNMYNAYNCYFLAYGEAKEDLYDYDGDGCDEYNKEKYKENRCAAVGVSGRGQTQNVANAKGAGRNQTIGSSGNSGNGKNSSNSGNRNGSGRNLNQSGSLSSNVNQHNQSSSSGRQNYNSGNQNQANVEDDWDKPTASNSCSNNGNYNSQSQSGNWNGNQNNGDGDQWDGPGNQTQGSYRNQNQGNSSQYNNQTQNVKIITPRSDKAVQYDDPGMPQPPPDMTLATTDIVIIKYCGVTGVFLAFLVFCCQTAILALVSETGVNIGVGIWGALYYVATGVITVYNGLKPTSQSSMAIFILQSLQFVLSVPLVGISYYILAVFGSCIQHIPAAECPENIAAGVSVTCLGGLMAIAGTVQGLTSLILMLICSQAVCGIRCMVSGATVHPTL